MFKANVVFTLEGANLTIQCSKSEKMRDICERFASKSEKNINSLIFLYGGGQLNLDLTFEEHANSMDKANNEMKVLVYLNEVNWSERKKELINEGIEIMRHKLESNLNTKDLNQIINNLIDEITDSGLFDSLQDDKYFEEVFDELKNIAKIMGQKYIYQKVIEEKQMQEFEQKLRELKRKSEEEELKRKIIKLKKEIKERRRRENEEGRRNSYSYFPKPNYNGCSIVDALKNIGANSRYEYRSIIAARNNIEEYVGSPKQNIKMLRLLKKGELIRP